jgi:hypothetical protein
MQQSLATRRGMGAAPARPMPRALLAEAYGKIGQTGEGLRLPQFSG